jgi:putative redox protein
MVRIEVEYTGSLRTRCRHEPSAAAFETDAPRDNEGLGANFSPTDLVATALGSCMLTTMGIVARRHEWAMEGATAEIEKHMATDPVRRIGRLVVRFAMPAGVPDDARPVLERAAYTCPVHKSLHPDVELDIEFAWR